MKNQVAQLMGRTELESEVYRCHNQMSCFCDGMLDKRVFFLPVVFVVLVIVLSLIHVNSRTLSIKTALMDPSGAAFCTSSGHSRCF